MDDKACTRADRLEVRGREAAVRAADVALDGAELGAELGAEGAAGFWCFLYREKEGVGEDKE